MSKSDPNSAIFMEDTVVEVDRKIQKAFCPEGQVEDNPLLDYLKYIIFGQSSVEFVVGRAKENGGGVAYFTYE
jgi:tyrosyl-tRNA synthetase